MGTQCSEIWLKEQQVWAKIANHMKRWSNILDASAQAWFDRVPFQLSLHRTCKPSQHHNRSSPIHCAPSKWHRVFSWNVLVASGEEATWFLGTPFMDKFVFSAFKPSSSATPTDQPIFRLNLPVSGQRTQLPPVRFRAGPAGNISRGASNFCSNRCFNHKPFAWTLLPSCGCPRFTFALPGLSCFEFKWSKYV